MGLGGGYQQPQSAGFKVAKSTLVPLGGGTGALGPQQRRALPAAAASSSAYPEKPGKPAPSESLEKEYIYNLQQQVYFLELELKYSREQGGKGAVIDPGSSEPLDSSLTKLKGSYRQMEKEFKVSMEQEEARQTELREAALQAHLHEKNAREDKQKAVEQLAKVREQFSSQRQELTAEVVALQRELERCYLTEKTLRMELEQATTQLQELKALSEGADAKVRMSESLLTEKEKQLEQSIEREGALKKELTDQQAQHVVVSDQLKIVAAREKSMMDSLKDKMNAAGKAEEDLRLLKIEFEKQKQALETAEQANEFLVRENAKLNTARDMTANRLAIKEQEVRLCHVWLGAHPSTGPDWPRLAHHISHARFASHAGTERNACGGGGEGQADQGDVALHDPQDA